jgi:hypothetical protein
MKTYTYKALRSHVVDVVDDAVRGAVDQDELKAVKVAVEYIVYDTMCWALEDVVTGRTFYDLQYR